MGSRSSSKKPAQPPPLPPGVMMPPPQGMQPMVRPPMYGGPGMGWPGVTPCPNQIMDTDFTRLALLSGLDVYTVRRLYDEFMRLTNGMGRLERDQYRRIFLSSFQIPAIQNLERLAEQSFRTFDRDSNGVLDFLEFIAAYKATSDQLNPYNSPSSPVY